MAENQVLLVSAISIGILHTLIGPDHYVPLAVMAKAGKWSLGKTAGITLSCGAGHVAASLALGIAGATLGYSLFRLEGIESFRGDMAAWFMIAFGLVYAGHALRDAWRNRPHEHWHGHADGMIHCHSHGHFEEHVHSRLGPRAFPGAQPQQASGLSQPSSEAERVRSPRRGYSPGVQAPGEWPSEARSLDDHAVGETGTPNPWIFYALAILGPCEPLIPLVMYPATRGDFLGCLAVACSFSVATLLTMLMAVAVWWAGLALLPSVAWEKYGAVFAGLSLSLCGFTIQIFNL